MPTVVVYTDKGEQVWQSVALALAIDRLHCPGNTTGATFAAALRQAVRDAEALEQGRVPEEHETETLSGWNVAAYTKRHMENLTYKGRTVELFRRGDDRDQNRARSRILNAARRLNMQVETRTADGRIIGTVKEQK
jgi:hypothetical protein